ncbi:GNAT family N-acetyltransferase [Phreatobacter sp.]|uniref:GNAT family N-acetyltransferase n=1 Tax=Phreatobacter sp. TaxID=1966341 RepID=UPI003F7143DB
MGLAELRAPIETERFRLVPLGRWRAFLLTYAWTKDSAFMSSYCGSGERRSPWSWYREMIRPNNRTKFVHAIVPHGQTKPIGVHIVAMRPYRSCLLAVGIHDRDWWGKAVVQEVRTRLIDHVFAHSRVERLYAQVMARNFPSIFNYRKLGFTHVGTLHRIRLDPATGEVHDMLIFEMFREEWMAKKTDAR